MIGDQYTKRQLETVRAIARHGGDGRAASRHVFALCDAIERRDAEIARLTSMRVDEMLATSSVASVPDGPVDLNSVCASLARLRGDLLCADSSALAPFADQFYLLGIGALEQAERFMKLAGFDQAREIAGAR